MDACKDTWQAHNGLREYLVARGELTVEQRKRANVRKTPSIADKDMATTKPCWTITRVCESATG